MFSHPAPQSIHNRPPCRGSSFFVEGRREKKGKEMQGRRYPMTRVCKKHTFRPPAQVAPGKCAARFILIKTIATCWAIEGESEGCTQKETDVVRVAG